MNDLLRDKALEALETLLSRAQNIYGVLYYAEPWGHQTDPSFVSAREAITSLRAAAPVVQQGVSDEQIDNATAAHFGLTYRDSMSLMLMHRRFARSILSLAQAAPAGVPAGANDCRIALIVTIDGLISQIENTLYAFKGDAEAIRQAEGAIAHARKVAEPWRWNGSWPGEAPAAPAGVPLSDAPQAQQDDKPVAPAGFKLVPLEPTDEMLEAGRQAGDFHIMHYDGMDKPGTPRYSLRQSYAAMLDAAFPTAPAPAGAEALQDAARSVTPDQAHTVACMDSWARAQGLATYSEMEDALRDLLDMWHGGHLQVRPEASGAWHAVVQAGEDALSSVAAPAGASEILTRLRDSIEPGDLSQYRGWNDIHRDGMRAGLEQALAALSGAPGVAAEPLTDERIESLLPRVRHKLGEAAQQRVIGMLIEVARAAFTAADDTEDAGDSDFVKMDRDGYDALCAELDKLDELPDDQPGVTMSGPARAEWALRALLGIGSPGAKEDGQHG